MRRFALAKVSAELTKGVSWSRNGKPIISCVRKLAPIASQARHFPPISGEADTKEERIHIKKAAPAYFVKAVCCGAVMLIFVIDAQKNFSFLPRW